MLAGSMEIVRAGVDVWWVLLQCRFDGLPNVEVVGAAELVQRFDDVAVRVTDLREALRGEGLPVWHRAAQFAEQVGPVAGEEVVLEAKNLLAQPS